VNVDVRFIGQTRRGNRSFIGPRPPLRRVTSDVIGEGVIRLMYVPA
jgi:hypothetical protein